MSIIINEFFFLNKLAIICGISIHTVFINFSSIQYLLFLIPIFKDQNAKSDNSRILKLGFDSEGIYLSHEFYVFNLYFDLFYWDIKIFFKLVYLYV